MKRLIVVGVLALLFGAHGIANGQEPERRHIEVSGDADAAQYIPEGEVIVYGVDFSKVQIYGAKESAEQFANAFVAINALFVSQPEKYDCSGLLQKQCVVYTYPTDRLVGSINWQYAMCSNGKPQMYPVGDMIRAYQLPHKEGIGLVFIAWLLDKAHDTAYYDVVCFDIKTRTVLFDTTTSGRAGGFSLRNFWANSVYKIISNRALRKQIEL